MKPCAVSEVNPTGRSRALGGLGGGLVFMAGAQVLALGVSQTPARITPSVALGILAASAVAGAVYGLAVTRGEGKPAPALHAPALFALPVALAAAGCYAGLWWVAWQKPDLTWDGNATHIPVVHFWALEGAVHWITRHPSDWTAHIQGAWNTMPKAANVFAFLFVQGTQAHRLLNAYNLPWLPLGVLGTYVLTRELGASRRTALLAGALFILTPVIITLGPTAYVDGAAAAVFAAWLGLLAVTYGRFARGQVPWGLAPAVAAAAGLTIGVKITGAVLGAMGLAMYLPGMLAGLRQGTGPARRFAFAALGWLGVVIAGMLLAGGYWYARNYARNGNPVYPIEVAAAGRVIFPGQAPSAMLRPGSGEAEGTVAWSQASRVAYSWLQGLDRWPVSIRSHDSKEGGLGYAWLLAGLPGILAFAVATASRAALPPGRRPLREIPLTTVFLPLLLVVAVTFVLRPWNHWPRHTVWLVALGLPCWAVLVERLFRAGTPGPRRAGRAWLAAVLAIALFEAGYAFAWTATRCYVRHPTWPGFRENPVVAARSLTWYDPVGYMQPDLAGGPFEAMFAGSAPVAVGSFEAELLLLVGRLSQPIGARPIHFIDWETAAGRSHLEAYVRERHIRYLIWSAVYPYPDTLDRVAVRHARAGQWFHVFEFARQTPDATGAEPDD